MSEASLREQLYAAFKNRAMLYHHMFAALTERLGEKAATEIMQDAIYRRGREIGQRFGRIDPDDMEGIKDAFLAIIPDEGRMFDPHIHRCDENGVDIYFNRCPLKEAWLEAGLPEDRVEKLCAIAARVDNGTFEAGGFAFFADTWRRGEPGCCYLHIRPGRRTGQEAGHRDPTFAREYDQGFSAYGEKKSLTDNPYDADSAKHLAWEGGWSAARDEERARSGD